MSSVFKENVIKVEPEGVDLQTDLSLKTRVNDVWNVVPSEQYPTVSHSEMCVIKVECIFWFY